MTRVCLLHSHDREGMIERRYGSFGLFEAGNECVVLYKRAMPMRITLYSNEGVIKYSFKSFGTLLVVLSGNDGLEAKLFMLMTGVKNCAVSPVTAGRCTMEQGCGTATSTLCAPLPFLGNLDSIRTAVGRTQPQDRMGESLHTWFFYFG